MGDFNPNLQTVGEHSDEDDVEGDVVLGVPGGSTSSEEWVQPIARGNILFLAIEDDLSKLASGSARNIKDMGGQLMHFRKFPVVSPPGVNINTDNL